MPLPDRDYQWAIELARRIASEVGPPRFPLEKDREVTLSRDLFVSEPLIAEGLRIVGRQRECPGHGRLHIEKVAIDLGALILIEEEEPPAEGVRRRVLLAHLAGIFHDICRTEKDHAERGARETRRLLAAFPLRDDELDEIAQAIGSHEAFRPERAAASPAAQLLADALYDADKFRWGPDNFTETLWAMVAPLGVRLEALIPKFLPGLDGIRKIRESFRTPTGREYGPDFIDRGLAIGQRLFAELTRSGEK